jgi:DNA-binding transcriptional regulator YiaG
MPRYVTTGPDVRSLLTRCQLPISLCKPKVAVIDSLQPFNERTVDVMKRSDLLLLAQAHAWANSGRARQLRISNGLTQLQVASHCRVTAACVSHWEAASRTPRGTPGLRWAQLLSSLAARSVTA